MTRNFLNIYLHSSIMQHIYGFKQILFYFLQLANEIISLQNLGIFKTTSHLCPYLECTLESLFCECTYV
jgi:hypothetical protein